MAPASTGARLEAGDHAALTIASLYDGRPAPDAEHVEVALAVGDRALVVEVEAPFHRDPVPACPAGSTPRLWEHEVVEVMLLGDDARYLEVELGPHGHYLALELSGVRRVAREGMELVFEAHVAADRWRGRAEIPRAWLPRGTARLNAFAIHGAGDARRYLAWRPPNVPGEAPDFHRLEAFGDWSATRR